MPMDDFDDDLDEIGETDDGLLELTDGVNRSIDEFNAHGRHAERSERARSVDDRRKAEKTTDYDRWKENPDRTDFPNVDDPMELDALEDDL